jgi:uncharacterized protein (TIGR02996 family)
MDQTQAFLQAMLETPRDLALRLIFADWLEEHGDPRGELLRLTHYLTQEIDQLNRRRMEDRLRALLEAGVQPVGPFWTNEVGIRFAWVPPGVFLMGSPDRESQRREDETRHRVRLTRGLWFGVHAVTQAQWRPVMDTTPSHFQGEDFPVDLVAWGDCQAFCAALRERDGRRYALPTEAEWEYACRAGTTTPFHFGTALNGLQANCDGTNPYGSVVQGPNLEEPAVVGSYPANAFGLHDMHGNVWEWCQDWFAPYASPPEGVEDPVHLQESPDGRCGRGGSWYSPAWSCRSGHRGRFDPRYGGFNLGFRICFRLD